MTEKIVTGRRAIIQLGDIPIEVFEIGDGDYGYTYEWLADLIQQDKKILSDKKSIWGLSKLTKGLVANGSVNPKVRVNSISYVYLTSDQLALVLQGACLLEPEVFLPLLTACAIEALERRADKAFNNLRTEKEYNDRFIARRATKDSFWWFVPEIKSWLDSREVPSSNPTSHYINAFRVMSIGLFGKAPKLIKEELGISKGDLNRDHFGVESLRRIDQIQRLAKANLQRGSRPMEAVQEAVEAMNFEIIDYKS
jgi:hypothetical protein